MGQERADLRSERSDLRSKRPFLGSKGLHLQSGKPVLRLGGDGQTDGNHRKLPYMESKIIDPPGLLPKRI